MKSQLKQLGLTEYEIQVYLTLLEDGAKKGGEISKLSKVPHGKTYQSLESLKDKGFISIFPVKPKVFSPVKPELAIKNYSNIKINNIRKLENELIKNLKEIPKTISEPKVLDKFTMIHGLKRERELSRYTYTICKKYIKNMSTYEFVSSNARTEARKRDVKIFQIATKMSEDTRYIIKTESKEGIKIRYYPLEELRLKIIDGEKSVMTIVNPNNIKDRIAVFVESKELSKAYEHYFDKIWDKSKVI